MLLRPRKDEENLGKGKDGFGNRLVINDKVVRASCAKIV